MWAKTLSSSGSISVASSKSNSARRERWLNGCARGERVFYTKTGVGTLVAEGKERKEFDGAVYILERGIRTDIALVKAWKADKAGNLIYRKTARNFNPMIATCGRITVAEAEILAEPGELDPDSIHTPGIFVQRVVHNPHPVKRIEQRTLRKA
jgi:3-oxoacid CoA-transferase subunit A